MKKAFLRVFLFLLFLTVLMVDSVNPAAEENMIYIRSDGSVDPSTAPIERDGSVYTFTDDVHGSIIVEKDNVVIDGAGFTLQGTGASDYRFAIPEFNINYWTNVTDIPKYDETIIPESNNTGIYSHAQKLTIMNLKITKFWCAIELEYSSDNCIIDNEITGNTQSVWIHFSSNNTISGNNIRNSKQGITLTTAHSNIYANNITDSSEYGIRLFWSFNNISENRVTNSGCGVSFTESTHNVFRNNSFSENSQVFCAAGASFQEYLQDVDNSNLANDKPIYYWINKQDLTVPTDAGWVTLVNCTRIRVENLTLAYGQKISLISTTNSTVTKNVMKQNQVCIYLDESSNNTIEGNTITDSAYGIQLEGSSNNHISCNNVTDNTKGIALVSSTKNVIQQNHITGNNQGIKMTKATGNIISGNNLTANVQGISLDRTVNIDSKDPYNSTIAHRCSDNTFSENNIIDNNCGVWMRSASNNTFLGNNFINNTDQIKMEDSVDISIYINTNQTSLEQSQFIVPNGTVTVNNQTGSEQLTSTLSSGNGTNQTIIEFPSVNFWDDGNEGNYWSNYTGSDSNGDGVGDTPYVIDENNRDNYPLMKPLVIPEVLDDEKSAISNLIVVAIAVVIVLGILFGVAFYRRKKMGNQQTPIH